jgi:hypothetical protein
VKGIVAFLISILFYLPYRSLSRLLSRSFSNIRMGNIFVEIDSVSNSLYFIVPVLAFRDRCHYICIYSKTRRNASLITYRITLKLPSGHIRSA